MAGSLAQGALVAGATWVSLRLLKWAFDVNPLDNLPGPPGGSFLAGHFYEVFDPDGWDYQKGIAALYGSVIKLRGAFGSKALFVYDPKALYHIIVKDQHIFEETEGFTIGNALVFGKGLFATTGAEHRKQRKALNPVFSTTHTRDMIPLFYDVAHKVRDSFGRIVSSGSQEIEVLDWMSPGLGHTFDSLTEDAEVNYYTRGVREYNDINNRLNIARLYILPLVYNIGTPNFRRWVIDILPWKTLKEMRDVVDILQSTAEEVAVARRVGRGKDIMSILLRANIEASEEDKLSDDEFARGFTFAAMDTTSNAMSRTLHLLSQNPAAQDKLRAEIRQMYARYGRDRLEYDELESLPYLDAVCRETLRVHPPVHTLMRDTREDIVLPFSKPVRGIDGSEIHEVLVPKGTTVFPSLQSSNCNPDIWGPDSFEWKPERWIEGLPESVAKAKIPGIYSHLMTFIGGGRACIGFKFAQLEMKVVLCSLLDKFKFSPVKGKEIRWKMTGIVTPAVAGEPGLQMPLIVGLAD
ncbi:cytochrome P450 [Coprinellus micaceus]|uniref:Cytochrome P450 n=1 Tax=Coprinellus micaceus TaxID=71717 RepID=A0A4Y7TZJ4_COPMI|nr:cytochrome P450 [Coprinellus micaceus]